MSALRACLRCGKELIHRSKNQKYCSRSCQGAQWVEAKRGFWDHSPRSCVWCGKEFDPRHRKHVFCSVFCYRKHKNSLRVSSFDNNPRACKECGEVFTPRTSKHVFCSKICSEKHRDRLRVVKWDRGPRVCGRCGVVFMPGSHRQKYCIPSCVKPKRVVKPKKKVKKAKPVPKIRVDKAKVAKPVSKPRVFKPKVVKKVLPRVCNQCGKEFISIYGNQKYCCAECRKAHLRVGRPKKPIFCRGCQKTFTPHHHKQKYCSPGCRVVYFEGIRAEKRRRREVNRRPDPVLRPSYPPEVLEWLRVRNFENMVFFYAEELLKLQSGGGESVDLGVSARRSLLKHGVLVSNGYQVGRVRHIHPEIREGKYIITERALEVLNGAEGGSLGG